MNVTTKYLCDGCCELHEREWEAEDCCRPEVFERFVCGDCGDTFSDIEEAQECCFDEDAPLPMPTPQELEAMGQERLFA